jgi:hypothetical protein
MAAVLAIYRHCIPIGLLPQENADRQRGLVRMRIKEEKSLRKREQSETTFLPEGFVPQQAQWIHRISGFSSVSPLNFSFPGNNRSYDYGTALCGCEWKSRVATLPDASQA